MTDPLRLAAVADRIEADLRGNILPFWIEHVADRPRGTFRGALTNDLVPDDDAERGALLTSRILWTFAAAFRAWREPAHLAMADFAQADLMGRFHDGRYGGFFWSVSADGAVRRDRKQVYGQAFAIYALAEYYAATGRRTPLDHAIATFRLLERHARDRRHGGYFEAFARDWSPIADVRLSDADQNDPKSQNTMLHVMEAYTNLLRAWPDAELRAALAELVGVMLDRVVDPATSHLRLFFAEDWTPHSDRISYGHDIEASWLLMEATAVLGDPALVARARRLAVRIADVTLAEGVDADGGVFNLGSPAGLVDMNKEWWPQAEAVVGFLNAYDVSGDERHLSAAVRTWEFIEHHLIDRARGEWFRGVTRDGRVLDSFAKVGFWKCPYHNGRMGLEAVRRLRAFPGRVAPRLSS
ncbi:MAG TPA: AGE family epimerase/isomerase [Lacunisphaera sp.]|jgi:mannobiose 2-epimerase|nr:AGE family epimerase/isomerase [Lacunisphaera sp.]